MLFKTTDFVSFNGFNPKKKLSHSIGNKIISLYINYRLFSKKTLCKRCKDNLKKKKSNFIKC